ncbi:hypothetical protein PCANC_26269 [Puccinia coronata f. sp. avenae]|uniref:Uncharacterized protein n=1 Tax=Puccinia coronata f. sp. avenae TaxID=200324 RepID=A0A2N5TB59_9BASI|nr:hypothetical protein PCANC_26269 [Puccinia coronata f. sp. avenae]
MACCLVARRDGGTALDEGGDDGCAGGAHTKRGRICSPSWVAPDLVISPLALSPPASSPTDITPTAPLTHITPPPPRRAEHNPAPPTVHHNYITTPQLSKQVP